MNYINAVWWLRCVVLVGRKLHQAYTRVQVGNYSLTPLVGTELRGKTVGVLGTGAIGTEAARMFKVGGAVSCLGEHTRVGSVHSV